MMAPFVSSAEESELRKQGLKAHDIKKDILGKRAEIKRWDLFVKKGASNGPRPIYVADKLKRGSQRTGYYLN
jgi:hypothetical protein